MQKQRCPVCGSEELTEEMFHMYNEWGEFAGTEVYKKCRKCGENIREDKKPEEESTKD
jgi:RNA polymerase subunit RPABC4/transcription elongation factor Spt4